MSNDFEFEFEDYDPLEAKPITKKSMVIFFVIDTSESMKGKKIDDLNRDNTTTCRGWWLQYRVEICSTFIFKWLQMDNIRTNDCGR